MNSFGFCLSLHRKPHFLFPEFLKRWSFQKNCAGIWSFLYYQERWYFFFPKICFYPLDGKWKMIFFKKIHGNMIFSSRVPKRWSFQKGLRWDMILLVLSGKMIFFTENMIFFPWKKSERWSFSRNTWGYGVFCVHVRVLQGWWRAPLSKKIKDNVIPQKYT